MNGTERESERLQNERRKKGREREDGSRHARSRSIYSFVHTLMAFVRRGREGREGRLPAGP